MKFGILKIGRHGIRTHVTLSRKHVLQTCAFNRSANLPYGDNVINQTFFSIVFVDIDISFGRVMVFSLLRVMERKNNQQLYAALREKYPVFVYKKFDFTYDEKGNQLDMKFSFESWEHTFQHLLSIPIPEVFASRISAGSDFSLLVFYIGMIELISYWKAVASPTVVVEAGYLAEQQITFRKKLYFNGLGEYFYLNDIEADRDTFMTITSSGKSLPKYTYELLNDEVLVPIWGGKDSVVTLELLRNAGFSVIPMSINPKGATLNCMEAAEISPWNYLTIFRYIDPYLLTLNNQGYLNGHIPFSAMLAFVSILISALTGSKYIALSNENSANESTVLGQNINHQYSKSLEFENDFRAYVKEYIDEQFNYFSFLRPLNELQIAQQFSLFSQYHEAFRSCNAGSKTDNWCCICAKCLFAYIILSPFFSPENLQEYFGINILDKEELKSCFRELLGLEGVKPFECIGTVEEVNVALALLIARYPESRDFLLIKYRLSLPSSWGYMDMDKQQFLSELSKEHNLEEKFFTILSNGDVSESWIK